MSAPVRSPRDAASVAKAEARRQAQSLSGAVPLLVGLGLVVLLMAIVLVLDYTLDLDPHRIYKVAAGLLAFGLIVVLPKFGLLLLPVVTPFLPWMPPTPVPGVNVLNGLLFAIFGTYAFNRIMRRSPLVPDNSLGRPLGLLLLVCALSVVRGAAFPTGYGYEGGLAALNLFRAATTFATYFIVMALARGPVDRERVWWAVLAGLFAESLVTAVYGRNGSGMRAIGSIGQSNDLGGFLALFAVPAMAGVFGLRNWLGKAAAAAVFALACFGVMLSLSRGSMVALVGGCFVVAWLSSRWAFLLLVAALALSPLWAPDYVIDRVMSSKKQVEGSDEVALDLAAEARLETWRTIFEVVKSHPVDGVGFTGLAYVLPDIGEGLGLEEVKDSAHNTWLRMISETGIIGLGLFVWVMWKCWLLAWRTMKRARRAFDRSLGIGLCGATVALAINCAFGDRFFNVVIASSFWILCALAENVLHETEKPA